jgi:cytochrome P450
MLNIPSYIGGNLIEGGADTTSAFLQTLVLALVNFPEVQVRAQEELDRVIGDERSPLLDDIERLPYIQAVIKEVGHHTTLLIQTLDLIDL